MSENKINQPAKKQVKSNSFVTSMLDALRQRILLIIIVVILAIVSGFVYNSIRKKDYTTYETVIYTTENTAEIDKTTGEIIESSTAHINAARKYISTVADFFKTGVVLERAEFYYAQFIAIMDVNGYADWERAYYIDRYIKSIDKTKLSDTNIEGNINHTGKDEKGNVVKKENNVLFDIIDNTDENNVKVYECYSGYMYDWFEGKNEDCFYFSNGEGEPIEIKKSLINEKNGYTVTFSSQVVKDDFFEGIREGKVEKGLCYFDVKLKDTSEVQKNLFYIEDNGENRVFYKNYGLSSEEKVEFAKDNIDYVVFSEYDAIYRDKAFSLTNSELKINSGDVSVSYDSKGDSFIYTISYKDYNNYHSLGKIKMIVLGANKESKVERTPSDTVTKDYSYFNVVTVNLNDINQNGAVVNASNRKILFFFALGGVGVALLLVYVLSFFDTTLKTREEVEKIAEIPLLASIEKAEEEDLL